MSRKKKTTLNQAGMVSFMVTMIMMLVITLIVLGFSQVTRRSQREALDRQLSTQAFYAAESGINVTQKTIQTYIDDNGADGLATKQSCLNGATPTDYSATDPNGNGGVISGLGTGVRYTCVLVNPNPKSLIYDVTAGESVVAPIKASGLLRSLTISWYKQDGAVDTSCGGANGYALPPVASWTCGYGVIRVELMAAPSPAALSNADQLNANTIVLYLTPLGAHGGVIPSTGGNVSYAGPKAYVGSGSGCGATTCSVTINLPGDTATYYARMNSIYRDAANTTITGTLQVGGGAALFNGSQAVVDVTGQAQDELRRVQVRLALTPTADPSSIPMNALSSSADICKHFTIAPTDNVTASGVCD